MKKLIAILGVIVFVWSGLWLALIAEVAESPFDQGGLSLLAAISFCVAILFVGYGNSLKWKKGKE